MKLLFFLAVWKRPEITEICFMGLNRLKKLGKFPMEFFAVISEESMIPLCEKYGVDWCIHKNHPIGEKKNYGVSQSLKKEWDYMIEIGSDDLLKNEFLDVYSWDAPVLGLNDVILINTVTGACKKLSSKISRYGIGRAISRVAIEKCGNIWHESLSRGLDNSSCARLAVNGFGEKRISCPEPVAIGLKSDVNIWPYSATFGGKYPLEKALSGLSSEEVNALECLYATAQV
jgi:hypothetical protein